MKKLLSILLAIAMLFSLGVSALADGDNDTIVSTESGSNSASTAVKVSYTPTSGGATATDEAKWGTDKDNLPNSGTLEAAIAAARTDSNVKYIQLQKNLNITVSYEITGGVFTLDLNGKTVYASGCSAFKIGSASTPATYAMARSSSTTSVTFINDGTVISTGAAAVEVNGGEVEIQSGSYTGDPAVSIGDETELTITSGASISSNGKTAVENNGGTLTIEGGNIYAGTQNAVTLNGGSTTVTGGSFYTDTSSTDETHASVEYVDGQLDLSGYSGVTRLTVHNGSDSDVEHDNDTNIILSDNHGFVDDDGCAIDTLASGSTYSIAGSSDDESTTTDEAKWGADKDNLTGSGTLEAAIAAANAGNAAYIQLQKDATKSDGYVINGGSFTLDLNGKTISSSQYTITIDDSDVDMIFADSSSGGKVETTGSEQGYLAITVQSGKVTFAGGVYGGIQMDLGGNAASDANVIINGGSFTKINDCAITNNGGKLTINDGMFSGRLIVEGTTTITGGRFSAGVYEHINYQGGTLDLSNYNGTTALTDLTVWNSVEDLTVSDSTIKLPEGYGFYATSDEDKTTVTELVMDTTYAIQSTSGGTTTTAEAKWGASSTSLPNSGTLEAAIAAANAGSAAYIQLQKDVTASVAYKILGGAFTLDLNGKTISSSVCAFEIGNSATNSTSGIDVTFTDSASGGKVETTQESNPAIEVLCGAVTFDGGSYGTLSMSAYGSDVPHANVTVKRGSFTSDKGNAIKNIGGTLTIEGGSFTGYIYALAVHGTTTIKGGSFTTTISEADYAAPIQYYSGKLDLSDYSAIADLTVYAGYAVTVSDSTIKLPSGYGFYKSDDTTQATVTELAADTNYAIKSTSGGTTTTAEAKWGTSSTDLPNSGTLEAAIAAANAGSAAYIQLQTDVTATSYYEISGNITVTIDLAGHGVTNSESEVFLLQSEASGAPTVTIKDGGTTGKVETTGTEKAAIAVNAGTLTITGGSYTGTETALSISNTNETANVTIVNGAFSTTGERKYAINNGEDGTLTIKNGTFTGSAGSESKAVNSGGVLTIEGGTFTGDEGTLVVSGTVTITGGSFSFTNPHDYASTIQYWGGKLDLSGYTGTITGLTVYAGGDVTVGAETIVLPDGYGFYAKDGEDKTTVTELKEGTVYAIQSTSGGTTTDTATITGVTVTVDGETYTNSNTTADAPAVITSASTVTVTVGGTNLNSAGEQNRLKWDGGTYLVKSTEWTINDEGTTATRTVEASEFAALTDVKQIQYSNDGGQNWTDTGVYIIYGYTVTNATAAEAHGTVTADNTKVKEGDKVTLTVTPDTGYGIDTISVKRGDEDVDVTQEMGGAIYFTMPKGDVTVTVTFRELAKITGISVTVGNQTYTSGQTVSLNAATGDVTITVSGTNFDALTGNNKFALLVNDQPQSSSSLNGTAWTVDKENNTATMTVESSGFENYSSAVQLVYSNDGTTWVGSGVYLTYQETISVSITWGNMSFTYDDTTTDEGDDKGWTGDGNTITVKNESSISVSPSVTYTAASGYTDITGTITPATNANALNKGDSMTYTLTLSGTPKASIEAGTTVGTVTVTITQAQ